MYYWHIHHDSLCEAREGSLDARIEDIKTNKPAWQRETRLRLMQPCKDQAAVAQAWEAYGKAVAQAREMYHKAVARAWGAWEAYGKAVAQAREPLEALHRLECPNCPWDGHTIFPGVNFDTGKPRTNGQG